MISLITNAPIVFDNCSDNRLRGAKSMRMMRPSAINRPTSRRLRVEPEHSPQDDAIEIWLQAISLGVERAERFGPRVWAISRHSALRTVGSKSRSGSW